MIVEKSPGMRPVASRAGSIGPMPFEPVPGSIIYPRNKFRQAFWTAERTGKQQMELLLCHEVTRLHFRAGGCGLAACLVSSVGISAIGSNQ